MPKPPEQHFVDELLGIVCGQRGSERKDDHVVDPALDEHLRPLRSRRKEQRCRRGVHDFERVRGEGHENAREAGRPGTRGETREHEAMAAMDAVECAHGQHRAVDSRRQPRGDERVARRGAVRHRASPRAAASGRRRATKPVRRRRRARAKDRSRRKLSVVAWPRFRHRRCRWEPTRSPPSTAEMPTSRPARLRF